MQCEHSQAEPHSQSCCKRVKPEDLPTSLPNNITPWIHLASDPTQKMHITSVKFLEAFIGRGHVFLNKSLIPSSGLKFKHKCCWKSSHGCSDVLALGSQDIGSVAAWAPIQEAGIRLSVELSGRMQSKEARDTHFPKKHQFLYKKKNPTVLMLSQDRSFRKGEKSSVKGTTKEVCP